MYWFHIFKLLTPIIVSVKTSFPVVQIIREWETKQESLLFQYTDYYVHFIYSKIATPRLSLIKGVYVLAIGVEKG